MNTSELVHEIKDQIVQKNRHLCGLEQEHEPDYEKMREYDIVYGERNGLQEALDIVLKGNFTYEKPKENYFFPYLIHATPLRLLWRSDNIVNDRIIGYKYSIHLNDGSVVSDHKTLGEALVPWYSQPWYRPIK